MWQGRSWILLRAAAAAAAARIVAVPLVATVRWIADARLVRSAHARAVVPLRIADARAAVPTRAADVRAAVPLRPVPLPIADVRMNVRLAVRIAPAPVGELAAP
jgi:hypothetical protein